MVPEFTLLHGGNTTLPVTTGWPRLPPCPAAAGQNPVPTANGASQKLTYTLVFQGQLGAEKGAVIGRVLQAPILIDANPVNGLLGTGITAPADSLDDRTTEKGSSRWVTSSPGVMAIDGAPRA